MAQDVWFAVWGPDFGWFVLIGLALSWVHTMTSMTRLGRALIVGLHTMEGGRD